MSMISNILNSFCKQEKKNIRDFSLIRMSDVALDNGGTYKEFKWCMNSFDADATPFSSIACSALMGAVEKMNVTGELGFVRRSESQIDLVVRNGQDSTVILSAVLESEGMI